MVSVTIIGHEQVSGTGFDARVLSSSATAEDNQATATNGRRFVPVDIINVAVRGNDVKFQLPVVNFSSGTLKFHFDFVNMDLSILSVDGIIRLDFLLLDFYCSLLVYMQSNDQMC